MNATTLLLSGEPNTEPSFLATVEPSSTLHHHQSPPFILPFEVILDGYTREPWSSGKIVDHSIKNGGDDDDDDTQQHKRAVMHNDCWQCCYLVSTDGKKRLSGFFQYLQERKKAAVAKFEAMDDVALLRPLNKSSSSSSCDGGGGKAILVVPYDPPQMPTEIVLPDGVDKSDVIFVKYLSDENVLKRNDNASYGHSQKLQQQQNVEQQQKIMMQQQQQQHTKLSRHQSQGQKQTSFLSEQLIRPYSSNGNKGGCLGKLLGAQRRTENHLDMVMQKKGSRDNYSTTTTFDPNMGAAGCINQFRNKISKELQLFKSDPTIVVTKFPMSHASLIKNVPQEEQDKVTFNVFKFAVYEQVEEIGMGQWVAAKEPSEFLDECIITVYKSGHCPADILDEINRGDLPDEIKGQARHMVESQSKAIVRKGKKQDDQMVKDAIVGEDNVVVLNTNKRDRRTLEQIQKDLQGESEDAKRGRFM